MRNRFLLLLAVVAALLPVSSASAVGTFGSLYRVSATCYDLVSALDSDGKTRGFQNCSAVRYVEGSGSHWTSSAAPFTGSVLAAAASGTTTFFLLTTSNGLYVKSRTAGGSYSAARKLSSVPNPEGAALAAYGGQWWAVWSVQTGQGGFSLFEAHTLLGNGTARRAYGSATSTIEDAHPSIVYAPSTRTAVIAWSHGASGGTLSTVRTTSKGGTWGAVSQVDKSGSGPVLGISGGTVVLADAHGTPKGNVLGVFVGGTTGAMSMHSSSLVLRDNNYRAAVSGGRVTAVYDGYASSGFLPRVVERNGTSWSEATFNQPAGGVVLDAQSVSGRARVFFGLSQGGVGVRSE